MHAGITMGDAVAQFECMHLWRPRPCFEKMESDSDSSNATGSDRNDFEGEEPDSDDDGRYISFEPRSQYARLMKGLRTAGRSSLVIWDRSVFDRIFANIDEFCEAVSNAKGIKLIDFGDGQGDDAEGPKLAITNDNASSWNKLLHTLSNVNSVEEVAVGGYNLSGSLMTRLVNALPQVKSISVFLPWHTLDGEDLRPFVEYLLDHPSKAVDPLCFNAVDNGSTQEGLFDGTTNHFLADGGILAQLFRLESVKYLRLHDITFTKAECQVFNSILSSEECKIKNIWVKECSFVGLGGKLFASAISSNESLKTFNVSDMFEDKAFCKELTSSLALNHSIEDVTFACRWSPTVANLDVVRLMLANLARRNKTIAKIAFIGQFFALKENGVQVLQRELQQNHTLESIQISEREQFRVITRLNKAGRRYLSEDSTSNSKCIAVLAKVKNDLDCLYYHLRENPILCMSYCNGRGRQSGNKRKAS